MTEPVFDTEDIPLMESVQLSRRLCRRIRPLEDPLQNILSDVGDSDESDMSIYSVDAMSPTLNYSLNPNVGSQDSSTNSNEMNLETGRNENAENESSDNIFDTTPDLSDAEENSPVIARQMQFELSQNISSDGEHTR